MIKDEPIEKYRKFCIRAARDLFYPREIETRIRCAKTERQISNIMRYARSESMRIR